MTSIVLTMLALTAPLGGAWVVLSRWYPDPRLSLPLAALTWSCWAVAGAELLRIDRWWLWPWWALAALPSLALLLRARRTITATVRAQMSTTGSASRLERAALLALVVIGLVTLMTGVVAAPNNWDSMTYHLARVEVWLQLHDVAHAATHVEPQLYQPPGAELLIVHGYVLSGSDSLAALVQWGAWLGCVLLGTLAASMLGANRAGQIGASVLIGSIPLAMLQASSTQNDLLLAFWLLLAMTLAVRIWSNRAQAVAVNAWLASVALGLAVLTKGTGLMFGFPVGVLLLAAVLRRRGPRRTIAITLVGLALAIVPNIGQWSRNFTTYGTLVATDHAGSENPYRVQDPDLGTFIANVVRNATNHMDLPWRSANDAIERGAIELLDSIGVDANDPRSTFFGQPFRVGPLGPHEAHAGSLLLLVLGLWAAVSALVARIRRRPNSGLQLTWLAVISTQVVLFDLLITWQNWHVRLHLPVTIAVAVLVAVRLAARPGRRVLVAACVVSLAATPVVLLANVTRPLIGPDSILTNARAQTRYQPRPQLQAPYEEVVRRVDDTGMRRVGLVTSIDDWQYPLLVAFRERGIDVEQVLVTGPSSRYANSEIPDAVVCVSCQPGQQQALAVSGLWITKLDADGPRTGRGDDVVTTELWMPR